jgi:hydrogenase maturation protease
VTDAVVVCLGNDLIADDALGPGTAQRLRARGLAARVVESSEGGLALLDEIVGFRRLVVVDAVLTGSAPPGTVHVVPAAGLPTSPGGAPHAVGLLEALELGRTIGLAVPSQVTIVAVEAEDLTGIGSPMTAPVAAAVDEVVQIVTGLVRSGGRRAAAREGPPASLQSADASAPSTQARPRAALGGQAGAEGGGAAR